MQLRHLLIASTASILMLGCVGQVSNSQDVKSSGNAVVTKASTPATSLAQSTKAQNTTAIKSGTFFSGEHTTKGIVRITTKDGKSILELDKSFKTSTSGPDLVVVLHRSDNVLGSTQPPSYSLKKGDYVVLAPLQKYNGAQSYAIPNNINLADYKSAAIWCRKFNATFGAAKLSG
ncbi:MAG: DM13 domain-containing protein [Aulosira sp. ZfuVER01]|nr:DM13 domain-containing protein [Aulosira sp. ZfuVER01]MDZ7996550.1 DM13 domain-containing protein [Aulosira sp. DedVER01a]MDZ8054461.1 DM13 domain-containing protein [Aulosira sp. ZfuCHP01]